MIKICVVIPVYNHEHAISHVVKAVLAANLTCILVDDGSTAACAQVLEQLVIAEPGRVILIHHSHNLGKGRAVLTGMQHATDAGYTHVLQIDADGQHNTADIPHFIMLANAHPAAVITGYPQYDKSVPKLRLYARYLTHVWVWINTLSFTIKDSMCGFRIYPLAPVNALAQRYKLGNRMDFDSHILVRLYWAGLEIINIPTQVNYPIDGVSHFRTILDNVLISRMHALLFFGMLWRSPSLLMRKISKQQRPKRHWAHINEVTFAAGMKFLFWIFRYLGYWPFRVFLYPVLLGYVITQSTARAASKKYLQRVYSFNNQVGIKPNLFGVIRHFSAFAESMLDKMQIWSGLNKFNNVNYYGQQPIVDAIAAGKGGMLLCSHYGSLDLCRVFAKRRAGLKLTVLVYTKHAQMFNKLLAQLDPTSQLNLMQVTEITPATALQLKEKIAQGEWIVITGDRISVSQQPRITFASFLGQIAPFPVGPYVLANLLQCPVFLLFAMRTSIGVELHFESFRQEVELPRNHREEAFALLSADYAARLEYFCLRAPLQWFNFYDFWHY